jgi:hypothetical protein
LRASLGCSAAAAAAAAAAIVKEVF